VSSKSIKLKFCSLFALFLAFILVLPACGTKSTGFEGPKVKNAITVPENQEPPSLDSSKTTDQVSSKVLNNVMEGLMRYDKDGKLTLGMAAEEPKESKDKKKLVFTLRDAKWSDGKPVTAYDFEYAWKRGLNPKTKSEYAFILYHLKNGEKYNKGKAKEEDVGVKALDEKTLEVKLESPKPFFKDLLTFATYYPLRKDIVEKYGDSYALEAKNMVFNGPFILAEWKHGKSFQLKKNDNYWDKDVVKLQQINFVIVKDSNTSLNLYKTNKVDCALLDGQLAGPYKDSKEKSSVKEAAITYIEMNQTKPIFKNLKMRKALAMSIDAEALTKNILKDGSIPADGFVPPVVKVNKGESSELFRDLAKGKKFFNPKEGKRLWDEGLKELGITTKPSLELVGTDNTVSKRLAEFIKEQLRNNLGVDITIASVPFKQRLERQRTGKFDLLLAGWMADYNDPMTFLDIFLSTSHMNNGKWKNKKYDELILKSQNTSNFEERTENLIKAEEILLEEIPVAPLAYRSHLILTKPYVKGIVWHSIGPECTFKWASVEK